MMHGARAPTGIRPQTREIIMSRWTEKQLNQFADAAQSLKLYRRAELLAEESEKSLTKQAIGEYFEGNESRHLEVPEG
jgi:hypothetical protein